MTGSSIGSKGYLGFYDSMVTVIPEGNSHEFLGWILPVINKLSFQRAFGLFSFDHSFFYKLITIMIVGIIILHLPIL